ncbi:SIMPL domain-containing protein [Catenovulum sediminis]|uniref:SIMPL domain-containing protein n=1 Tax=Catenovulum sediminis TaxID=1740262 RepID=A0ABV1RL81_9ALTE|nr:SIMPL domain-containing protein [Catenovulum sediminis]
MHRVLGCFLLLFVCACSAENTIHRDLITVDAVGSVNAIADKISVNLYIEQENKSVSQAKNWVDASTKKVIERLIKEGVAEQDISSYQLDIRPVYHHENHKAIQDGFKVTRTIVVEIKNWESFDEIIDKSLSLGVTRVGQIQTQVSDQYQLYLDALQKAITAAKEKAKLIARAAGRSIDKVVTVNEQGGFRPFSGVAEMRMMSDAKLSQPGQTEIQATIQVQFLMR